MQPPIRIGTRGSKLALWQAHWTQRAITAALGAPLKDAEHVAPLVVITTSGDRIQDRRLLEVGGKALFTKEIEAALSLGEIDCAVHSLKDVPAEPPPGLTLAAFPEREDPRDALVAPGLGGGALNGIDELPRGARLGTASLRRGAQALHRRPDLQIVLLRGNVDTRLAKLAAGECDAALLACAGLRRLGLERYIRAALDPREAPPAPGQGALAIQTRDADAGAPWVRALHHAPTALALAAERGALEALEGSCRTAMGAHAWRDGASLRIIVEALTPDGRDRWREEGLLEDADAPDAAMSARVLGLRLGGAVRDAGGDRLELP